MEVLKHKLLFTQIFTNVCWKKQWKVQIWKINKQNSNLKLNHTIFYHYCVPMPFTNAATFIFHQFLLNDMFSCSKKDCSNQMSVENVIHVVWTAAKLNAVLLYSWHYVFWWLIQSVPVCKFCDVTANVVDTMRKKVWLWIDSLGPASPKSRINLEMTSKCWSVSHRPGGLGSQDQSRSRTSVVSRFSRLSWSSFFFSLDIFKIETFALRFLLRLSR